MWGRCGVSRLRFITVWVCLAIVPALGLPWNGVRLVRLVHHDLGAFCATEIKSWAPGSGDRCWLLLVGFALQKHNVANQHIYACAQMGIDALAQEYWHVVIPLLCGSKQPLPTEKSTLESSAFTFLHKSSTVLICAKGRAVINWHLFCQLMSEPTVLSQAFHKFREGNTHSCFA